MIDEYSHLFEKRAYSRAGYTLPYRLMLPKGYDATRKYPLHVILHGAQERAVDNETQVSVTSACVAPWAVDGERTARPAFVLAPQCPPDQEWVGVHWADAGAPLPAIQGETWPGRYVLALVDSLCSEFASIDDSRIYISGGSMGSVGAWYMCQYRPNLFAAAILMAGSGDTSITAPFVNNIPIRVYGAELDEITPIAATRAMIGAIRAVGGSPHYIEVPGEGHTVLFFENAAADEEAHVWLFNQSRTRKEKRTTNLH